MILNFVKIQFNSDNCKHFPLHICTIYHMYMHIFKCTYIILFIFTILINFTIEIVSINTFQYV